MCGSTRHATPARPPLARSLPWATRPSLFDAMALAHGILSPSGDVIVRGLDMVRGLHSWAGGAFGELIAEDGPDGGDETHALRLMAAEAFYLAYAAQPCRLLISRPAAPRAAGTSDAAGAPMASETPAAAASALGKAECWDALTEAEPLVPQLYATYVALRAAGWRIRDGLKFGFDYALYDAAGGPAAHAPLGALVLEPDADGERSWLWLQRHVRVCHSVGKNLLLCHVQHVPAGDGGAAAAGPAGDLEVTTLRVRGWDVGKAHASA